MTKVKNKPVKKTKQNKIEQFDEFCKLFKKSKIVKSEILENILKNKKPIKQDVLFLKNMLKLLKKIKKKNGKYILQKDDEIIKASLEYELSELEKDIIYLEKGEKALLNHFQKVNKKFNKEIENGLKLLGNAEIKTFFTDRDGTINNYSERYETSIQSIYNAVFLSIFIKNTENTIILSSAPLKQMISVSLIPKNKVVYSGSHGREFFYKNRIKKFPISKRQEKILKSLTKEIKKLLQEKNYKKFTFIGSGFQEKHGQLTIARQDISNSINKKESENFLKEIKKTIKSVDSEKKYFHIHDTSLDIEIILKYSKSKNFDKGLGFNFIMKNLKPNTKNLLVCGDTSSDLEFLKKAKDLNKKSFCIFVTTKNKLKKEVKKIMPNSLIVSSPDVLVSLLGKIGEKKCQ